MNLKKIGKVFTSKFVGTGPSSYKNRKYRAAVSQRLRNTAIQNGRKLKEKEENQRDLLLRQVKVNLSHYRPVEVLRTPECLGCQPYVRTAFTTRYSFLVTRQKY